MSCRRMTKVEPYTRSVHLEGDTESALRKLAQYEDVCPSPEELRRMRNYYFAHNDGGCPCKKKS